MAKQLRVEIERRALDKLIETRMVEAYKAQPDVEPAHFDPRLWEPRRNGVRS